MGQGEGPAALLASGFPCGGGAEAENAVVKCLIVEDDARIAGVVEKALGTAGFLVHLEIHGDFALDRLRQEAFDVAVLDIMLPGRDGLSIVRGLREQGINTPVLLLTARSALTERVEGLESGADDYLSKPFHVEELVARVKALARRSATEGFTVLSLEDLTLNLATRAVSRGERAIALANREFALLEYLLRKKGRVLSRTQICEHVWGYYFDVNQNLVDVYIKRLREKLEAGGEARLIQTVRGIGYCLRGES